MIPTLRRVTTEFVEDEDRLRLAGDVENAPPVEMWLTQRLALRLLPPLFQWLDQQTGAASLQAATPSRSSVVASVQKQVVHNFAQEAAVAQFKPQPAVQVPAEGEGWLIQSVDLAPAEPSIALVFRAGDGRATGVSLMATELRQWLAILHGLWTRAQWPAGVWPDWIQREARPSGQQIVLH